MEGRTPRPVLFVSVVPVTAEEAVVGVRTPISQGESRGPGREVTSLCQVFLCTLSVRGLGLDALLPLTIAHDPGHMSQTLGRVRSCLAGALCRLLGGPYPCPVTWHSCVSLRRRSHVWGGPDEYSRKERMAWACFTEGLPSPSRRRGADPVLSRAVGSRLPQAF